jgi:hypothetical protein
VTLVAVVGVASFAKAATFFYATNMGNPIPLWSNPGDTKATSSGIIITRGASDAITGIVTIGNDQYANYAVNNYDLYTNQITHDSEIHLNVVWYFGTGTGVSDNGFKGNVEYKIVNFDPITFAGDFHIHGVLQGFGSFTGQTLKFDSNNPALWTGYCIVK